MNALKSFWPENIGTQKKKAIKWQNCWF